MARSIQTATDALDFFVQTQDSLTSILNVVSTATSGSVSADLKNTLHKGAIFYLTIASLSVNGVTLAVSFNGKDAATGNYMQLARVSLDGLLNAATAASLSYPITFYPGITVPTGNTTDTPVAISGVLPAVFQVTATLTMAAVTASTSNNISYRMGMSKIL